MATTIAITGKGGVGKTTVAGLLVARLIARGCCPVLAVDADPNTCLADVVGTACESTVGGVREDARQIAGQGVGAGVSKQQLLELKIAESLVEADDFDFLAMGRPEGPGCYCYANNVLKQAIHRLAESYPYVVIDNEAGLENLSRRIVRHVDLLLIVTDPSMQGLKTVSRLHDLAREMQVDYTRLVIVVNRMRHAQLPAEVEALRARTEADLVLGLPESAEIADAAEQGASVLTLSARNDVAARLDELVDGLSKLTVC